MINRLSIIVNLSTFFTLFQRIACHIQVFALSRWLAVTMPVDYYEFARGLQWSIPYFSLPWEAGNSFPAPSPYTSSKSFMTEGFGSEILKSTQLEEESSNKVTSIYGLPLTPTEYRMFFEVINMCFCCN